MLSPKLIIRLAVLVVVFYSLLMIPWPGLERGYARVFRAGGDAAWGFHQRIGEHESGGQKGPKPADD